MKFRGTLAISAAVSAAMVAAGCSPQPQPSNGWTADEDTAVCVDRRGNRVDDDYCDDDDRRGGYGFFYVGRGGHVPAYGKPVNARHGSYRAKPGVSYRPSSYGSSVSRGGFGSTGRGMSAGG